MKLQSTFFSLAFLVTPLLAQGAELDLRTTAKKGNSVWLVTVEKQESVIDAGGQEMETGQTLTRNLQVSVLGEEGGNLIVETKIARIQGTMVMPMGMGEMEFDSAEKDDDDADEGMGMSKGMIKKALGAGAGKSFRAKVSPFGKVIELLDGADELTKAKGGGMMGGGGLSKEQLSGFVESAFGFLPEKPTAVGGKWQHIAAKGGNQMPMSQKMDLTLAKADADSFEITATGTVEKPETKAEKKEEGAEEDENVAMAREMMQGMKLSNGKLTGSVKVSRKDGFVMEATSTVSVDAEMSSQMGEMKMAIKTTTTTKRTTEEAAMPKKAEPEKDGAKGEAKKDEPKKEAGK